MARMSYTVKKDDDWFKIATKTNNRAEALARANPNINTLSAGQVIDVPTTGQRGPQRGGAPVPGGPTLREQMRRARRRGVGGGRPPEVTPLPTATTLSPIRAFMPTDDAKTGRPPPITGYTGYVEPPLPERMPWPGILPNILGGLGGVFEAGATRPTGPHDTGYWDQGPGYRTPIITGYTGYRVPPPTGPITGYEGYPHGGREQVTDYYFSIGQKPATIMNSYQKKHEVDGLTSEALELMGYYFDEELDMWVLMDEAPEAPTFPTTEDWGRYGQRRWGRGGGGGKPGQPNLSRVYRPSTVTGRPPGRSYGGGVYNNPASYGLVNWRI